MWVVHVEQWEVVRGDRQLSTSTSIPLRCGKTYRVGRSETRTDNQSNDIVINKKNVSRSAGMIQIGLWQAGRASGGHPDLSPPEIAYTNETNFPASSTKKTQPTQKGKKPINVYTPRPTTPAASTLLADYEVVSEHDHFGLVHGSFISLLATGSEVLRFEWISAVIVAEGGNETFVVQKDQLKAFGIHLTHQFIPNLTTQVIAPQITLVKNTILAACSGIPICLPTWLNDLNTSLQGSKATLPLGGYHWPKEKDYMPEMGEGFEVHDPRAKKEWWMPMGDRKTVWRGKTVVMLTDKTRPEEDEYFTASGALVIDLDIVTRLPMHNQDLVKRLKPPMAKAKLYNRKVREEMTESGEITAMLPSEDDNLVVAISQQVMLAFDEAGADFQEMVMAPLQELEIGCNIGELYWKALTDCDWKDFLIVEGGDDVAGTQTLAARPSASQAVLHNHQILSSGNPETPTRASNPAVSPILPNTYNPSTHPEDGVTNAVDGQSSAGDAGYAGPSMIPETPMHTAKKPLKRRAGRNPAPFLLPLFDDEEDEVPPSKRPRFSEEQPATATPAGAIAPSIDRNRVIPDSPIDVDDQPRQPIFTQSKPKLLRRAAGGRKPSLFDVSMEEGGVALTFDTPVDPLARYRNTYNKSKQSGAESLEGGVSQADQEAMQVDEDEDIGEEEDYVRMSINAQKQAQQAKEKETEEARRSAATEALSAIQPSLASARASGNVAIPPTALAASSPAASARQPTQVTRDGTVDRDEVFLQIVGKVRKGAKEIDEFDKDFNALKITKSKKNAPTPGISRTGPMPIDYDALVAYFDTDTTGNFIRIEKRDLIRKDQKDAGHQAPNPDWAGRPNFKKFKKQKVIRREPIAMVLAPAADYGIGPTYWDAKREETTATQPPNQSQNLTQGRLPFSQAPQTTTQSAAPIKGRRKLLPIDEDSDGETIGPPLAKRTSAATRTQPSQSTTQRPSSRLASEEPPATAANKKKRKAPDKFAPLKVTGPIDLSLASDSEDGMASRAKRTRRATSSTIGDAEQAEDILPARSSRSSTTRSAAGTGRRKLLPVDDEDEEDVFGARGRRH